MINQNGIRAGIVCCSNGISPASSDRLRELEHALKKCGLEAVFSKYLYARDGLFSGTARERAESLMEFYRRKDISMIFDISGGEIANEILPYLDFDVIAASRTLFFGYSDLTTIINGIYARTGKPSVLYQVRNLIGSHGQQQTKEFARWMEKDEKALFDFDYEFLQGEAMKGIVAGGNIRCLLKLAGTRYWPDLQGKILLLEARSGTAAQMTTYLSQLQQLGIFEQISGLLLGTFTQMEREGCRPGIEELVKRFVGERLPIAKTQQIGHGSDSKAIVIGEEVELCMYI